MEDALLEIIDALREGEPVDAAWLDKLVRRHNRAAHDGKRTVAKRRLLPFYLRVKADEPERWAAWSIDDDIDRRLVRLLQAKPRRTASGVATITVLTKPWPCSSACVYCPNDIRMPKSYLADEPACQRAERCWFDPFLQVTARLKTLSDMGHVTDKVELIVLGGTWSDYPASYRRWFIGELFRALNESDEERAAEAAARRARYEAAGLPHERDELATACADVQRRIDEGALTYNAAWSLMYDSASHRAVAVASLHQRVDAGGPTYDEAWGLAHGALFTSARPFDPGLTASAQDGAQEMVALRASERNDPSLCSERRRGAPEAKDPGWDGIAALHRANETAPKRVVGLVVETRPDLITPESCLELRKLGCTKVQMGIQSLRDELLAANGRAITAARIGEAMGLLRLFGFKSHVHFMVNLLGATPAADVADYARLVTETAFLPDEVKLYPCCLVESSQLTRHFADGSWRPYTEDELVGVLCADVVNTPPYTRISRMIRDISATDIVAGNKKTNLRQVVEARLDAEGAPVREIRHREIATEGAAVEQLALETIAYATTTSEERFLQWVTPAGKIAGFLRLSLPKPEAVGALCAYLAAREADGAPSTCAAAFPLPFPSPRVAMIREVHVYGKVAALHRTGEGTQHLGLGRKLVEEACAQAEATGYAAVNVISAIGTRDYYRKLGFRDNGLYQQRPLGKEAKRSDAGANIERTTDAGATRPEVDADQPVADAAQAQDSGRPAPVPSRQARA